MSENALRHAREGLYPPRIAQAVSQARLRRFFTPVNGGHRIAGAVRNVRPYRGRRRSGDPALSRIPEPSARTRGTSPGAQVARKRRPMTWVDWNRSLKWAAVVPLAVWLLYLFVRWLQHALT